MYKRALYYNPNVDKPKSSEPVGEYNTSEPKSNFKLVEKIEDANLISSRLIDENNQPVTDELGYFLHMPVIDIDFPIEVYPSSQFGHYHLYINHPIPLYTYIGLLNALQKAGLCELGFVNASLANGFSAVRPPGVLKPDVPSGGDVLQENAKLRAENYKLSREVNDSIKALEESVGAIADGVNKFLEDYPEYREELLEHMTKSIEEKIKVTSATTQSNSPILL